MTTLRHPPRRRILGMLMVTAALPACQPKEPSTTAQQAPPSTAVATTTTVAATTTTTTLPPPPPAWRTAQWGMKKTEVLAAFPGEAQRLSAPADFGPSRPGRADLAIPAYETEATKFRVLFGFASDRLSRIQLFAAKAGTSTCEDVEKRLTADHGAPSSRNEAATSLLTKDFVWTVPIGTITLTCAEKPSLGFRTVTVDYAAPSPTIAN